MATPHSGVCHGLCYKMIYTAIIKGYLIMSNTNKDTFIDYKNLAAEMLVSGNAPDSNNLFTAFTKIASEMLGLMPYCRSKFQITAP